MRIIHKYSDPFGERHSREYDSLDKFKNAHPIYGHLLSEGRENHELEITITDKCCPFTETVIITREDEFSEI